MIIGTAGAIIGIIIQAGERSIVDQGINTVQAKPFWLGGGGFYDLIVEASTVAKMRFSKKDMRIVFRIL